MPPHQSANLVVVTHRSRIRITREGFAAWLLVILFAFPIAQSARAQEALEVTNADGQMLFRIDENGTVGIGVTIGIKNLLQVEQSTFDPTSRVLGAAGFFVSHPENPMAPLWAETAGPGVAVVAVQSGRGADIAHFQTLQDGQYQNVARIDRHGIGHFAGVRLTNGAAPGLVLTSDQNGYASWQPVSTEGGFALPFSGSASSDTPAFEASQYGSGMSGRFEIANSMSTAEVFNIHNGGLGRGLVIVNTNGGSSGNALDVFHNGGPQSFAGLFRSTNATNEYPAVQAHVAGTGSAFRAFSEGLGNGIDAYIGHPSNLATAVVGETRGLGSAAAFRIINMNNTSPALSAVSDGNEGTAIAATATGANAFGGSFAITNPNNGWSALWAETQGQGEALIAVQSGTGRDIALFQQGPHNNVARIDRDGIGHFAGLRLENGAAAGLVLTSDAEGNASWQAASGGALQLPYSATAASESPLFELSQTGTGPAASFSASSAAAVIGLSSGNTQAGYFANHDPANTMSVLDAGSYGQAAAVAGTNYGTGLAGSFVVESATNGSPALRAVTNGTGNAASFDISNIANPSSVISARTEGTGIAGSFDVANPNSESAAVSAFSSGNGPVIAAATHGNGHAGIFSINNPASTNWALHTETHGTGPALFANQNGASGNIAEFAANWGTVVTIERTGIGRFAGVQLRDGASPGYVLTSDEMGNASWQAAPAGGLQLPYSASASTDLPLFYLEQTGNSGAANFQTNNPANTMPSLTAVTNGGGAAVSGWNHGTGTGGEFIIPNALSEAPAVSASTDGLGSAGAFSSANPNTTSPTIYANAKGLAPVVAAWQDGTGHGATFQITGPANTQHAVLGHTLGSGAAVAGYSDGTGGAAHFQTGMNSTAAAVNISNDGTGTGLSISNNNVNSSTNALDVWNHGGPQAFAGVFTSTNSANEYPAVQAHVAGGGSAFRAFSEGTGNGIDVYVTSPLNEAAAVLGETQGLGKAAAFNIQNPASTQPALQAATIGTGPAIVAAAEANGAALWGQANGTGEALVAIQNGGGDNIAVFKDGGVNVARIDRNGVGYFNGGTQASGADLAEAFEVEGLRESYEPGDVLVISTRTDRSVEKSSTPYATHVAGVYATKPGMLLTERSIEESVDDLVPMGIVGVVPTKVSAENGPIQRGDLLVTSSTPGHAMKADPAKLGFGMVLGKALENFDATGTGLIKILVSLK